VGTRWTNCPLVEAYGSTSAYARIACEACSERLFSTQVKGRTEKYFGNDESAKGNLGVSQVEWVFLKATQKQ